MRPTSMALAVGAMVALAFAGCGRNLGQLIYNDSLLCGDDNQACAPDGGRFDIRIVDRTTYEVSNPSVPTFDMVAKPDSTVVGFAYVLKSPRQDSGVLAMFPDAGLVDYDIMFQEFDVDAGVGSGAQIVQTVQRFFGVSVAYQANGQPAVAYLGGPPDFTETFWFQNDAAIAYYQGGRWVEQVAAANSSPPVSGSAPSDNGKIVGFYPALIFEGNNAVLAYRDAHFGQSAGTGDWNSADLEMAVGGPTTWTPVALLEAGNSKRAYGGHSRIIYGAKTLSSGLRGAAVISDRAPSAPDTFGQDIEFSEQQSDGTWASCGALQPLTNVDTPSILGSNGATILPNTQSGPSIDYRDNFGYAVAVTDRSQNGALFTSCAANTNCLQPGGWDTLDPVFQRGSGGWYAAAAISPDGDPSVAYYVCSKLAGRNENNCTPDHYLAVANRGLSQVWSDHEVIVDTGAVFQTRMVYIGKRRVIGYRNGASGVLQIAVEKP
ncbi:MAG TPA: hypothetical protein VFI53_06000 [Myxococcaceae bacterium]|nr:hypothetical protein [Myxococcaceae bacterium]